MKTNKKMLASAFAAVAAMGAGCGGGGDEASSSVEGSPEGVYGGALSGASAGAFQMLVLENGEFWALYGTQSPSMFYVNGFIQGNGAWSQGSFSASEVRDFGVYPATVGRLTFTYNTKAGTISGQVSAGGQAATFTGGPIPASLYRYDTPATLTEVTGSWTLADLRGEAIALSVATDGKFTGSSTLGCKISGTMLPRSSGKNVFDVSLTFGPAPCQLAQQAGRGIAVLTPLANGRSQLVVAATDLARSVGTAAFGTR